MLTHLTDALTTLIQNLYGTTGLAGIVLAMAIESCCIPLPSEIVMPLAGIIIASFYTNHPLHLPGTSPAWPLWMNLILVALAGAVGCLLGSMAAYGIGYAGGRPLMLKYGRYLLISHHDSVKADRFFQRWGSATTFFSRLLPVVRTYISLPAGISRMPFAKFCIYTFLGSFPWCLLLAYVGTLIGGNLATLSPIFHSLDVAILIIAVVLIALYIWRHIHNERKAHVMELTTDTSTMQPPTQSQPEWGQQPQPGWGQQPQRQQSWDQPAQSQPEWGQQAQNWGQQPQQGQGQSGWPQRSQFQPPQPAWGRPQSPLPPSDRREDRTP